MTRFVESENRVELFDVANLGETVPVEILYVDSPASMWIRPTELKPRYDALTLTMMGHYIDEGKGRLVEREHLKNGKVCAVRHNTTVRRGRIIYVDDDGYTEVWFIDLGYSGFCYSSEIYHLEPEFTKIPATAIQCGLYDIQPNAVDWCDSAQRYILDASLGEIGIATVCTRVVENGTLWIKLSFNGNDIGADLVWDGEALPHRQRLRIHAF